MCVYCVSSNAYLFVKLSFQNIISKKIYYLYTKLAKIYYKYDNNLLFIYQSSLVNIFIINLNLHILIYHVKLMYFINFGILLFSLFFNII